jgi:hypothetical protein
MLATYWTAPGAGATVAELVSRIPTGTKFSPANDARWRELSRGLVGRAQRLTSLGVHEDAAQFEDYDVERALEALERMTK